MTLLTRLQAIGWFDVGEGADASGQYPILRITETHERVGVDAQNGEAFKHVTLTIESLAVASSETTNELVERIEDDLAHRGRRVRVNENAGTARVFNAGGATGGALAGWPRVRIETIPENSVPPIQHFRATIETREPITTGLPLHEYTRTESVDEQGLLTVRQRGSYRVENGADPKQQVIANVIAPAQSASQLAGRRFGYAITLPPDPTLVEYEFTDSPPGAVPPGDPNVDEAEVREVLTSSREGRRVRTISGFATGGGATTFAQNQAPGGSSFVVRQSISEPAVPTGRVEFSYEVLDGATHPSFMGLTLFSFEQTIERVSGGRSAQQSVYADADPLVTLGPKAAFFYREATRMEFRGAWADATVPFPSGFDADDLAATPVESRSTRQGGVKQLSLTRVYAFATEQTLPEPLEVATL